MPAPLRIILSPEQEYTLSELLEAKNLPQRTHDRAHMISLNAKGWNVPKIAGIFDYHEYTVRSTTASG